MERKWWHNKVAYQIYPKELFMIPTATESVICQESPF